MDWQSLVPFIPFFASFFGVLAAFGLQWLGRRRDKGQDRMKFLEDIKHELGISSTLLTEIGKLLPTDMWESGKASGFMSLLSHDVKVKFAAVYFGIANHNYESVKVRDVGILAETTKAEKPKADIEIEQEDQTIIAHTPYTHPQLLWNALTVRLQETEKALKKQIDDLLNESIWE